MKKIEINIPLKMNDNFKHLMELGSDKEKNTDKKNDLGGSEIILSEGVGESSSSSGSSSSSAPPSIRISKS
jgi:hypothetical protein